MKSGGKTVCKTTKGNVKNPCKPFKKAKKGKSFGAEMSGGILAAQIKKEDSGQSYLVGKLKFRAFSRFESGKASLGAQIQGFHGFYRFTDGKNKLGNKTLAGFSGGPFLEAQLIKNVPVRFALSPQIGAAFPNGRDPLLYLTFNIGIKYFLTKRFFLEGNINVGSIIEKGSGVDVHNGSEPTLPESDSKGYLIVSGGLNFGVTLY